ncbi:glycoside hydrolase family 71/99-like protein [Bacteroidota bacterium]
MKTIIVCLLTCLFISGYSQEKAKTDPMYPTYKGLIMAGYQGWFRAEGDEMNSAWGHYGRGGIFNTENNTIDIWPDVSDYKKTYETEFLYEDGTPAKVFSSVDESTTDLHFKWMKEYAIDGVFMQRFYGVTKSAERAKSADLILKNAFKASQKYDRAIAVMYDLSGLQPGKDDCDRVIEDWKRLVDDLKVLEFGEKQTYLHHNGKPLVTIWGVGFPDRSYDISKIKLERLLDFLKNDPVYGGCSVMLGVPTYFRELNKDCLPDPFLHEVIESADIVLPWMVQRFTPLVHKPMDHLRDHIKADITWCKQHGVDYVPIAYPGFSWRNLSLNKPELARYTAYGAIPRLGGQFFWDQMVTMVNAGAEMIYIAMFDEIDEGTAIFKVSDNPPNSDKAHFIDNDGAPADQYLFLTGEAGKMLRKERDVSYEIPDRK